jgi:hypothetical protein
MLFFLTLLSPRPVPVSVGRVPATVIRDETVRRHLVAGATLDDVREAVTTLEDVERIARRVLGGEHPLTVAIEDSLRTSREVLRVRSDGGRVKFV